MNSDLTGSRRKRIGRLLNAAIVLMLLVVAGILVRGSLSGPPAPPTLAPTARIFIEGVDWAKSEQTLLLALRRGCEYCSKSARFYRRLVEGLKGRTDARIVVVYPDETPRGEAYLKGLGLSPVESSRQTLSALGVGLVPTLALVGKDGLVSKVWVGELPPKKESEVMAALRFEDTRAVSEWTIDEGELERRTAGGEPVIVLDIRERWAYRNGHREGAKNIPWDEVYARSKNELPQDRTIVLYGDDEIRADMAYSDLFRLGYRNVLIGAGRAGGDTR